MKLSSHDPRTEWRSAAFETQDGTALCSFWPGLKRDTMLSRTRFQGFSTVLKARRAFAEDDQLKSSKHRTHRVTQPWPRSRELLNPIDNRDFVSSPLWKFDCGTGKLTRALEIQIHLPEIDLYSKDCPACEKGCLFERFKIRVRNMNIKTREI